MHIIHYRLVTLLDHMMLERYIFHHRRTIANIHYIVIHQLSYVFLLQLIHLYKFREYILLRLSFYTMFLILFLNLYLLFSLFLLFLSRCILDNQLVYMRLVLLQVPLLALLVFLYLSLIHI